jgi:hypothetical protein
MSHTSEYIMYHKGCRVMRKGDRMTMSNEKRGFYQLVIELREEDDAFAVYELLMKSARDIKESGGEEPNVKVYSVGAMVSGDA